MPFFTDPIQDICSMCGHVDDDLNSSRVNWVSV